MQKNSPPTKKIKADVICVQETHTRKKDCKYLQNKKLGKTFFARDMSKRKGGVAS